MLCPWNQSLIIMHQQISAFKSNLAISLWSLFWLPFLLFAAMHSCINCYDRVSENKDEHWSHWCKFLHGCSLLCSCHDSCWWIPRGLIDSCKACSFLQAQRFVLLSSLGICNFFSYSKDPSLIVGIWNLDVFNILCRWIQSWGRKVSKKSEAYSDSIRTFYFHPITVAIITGSLIFPFKFPRTSGPIIVMKI